MRVCEHAYKTGKVFAMTLSAKYICDDPIGVRLLSVIPFADIVFGYEDVSHLVEEKAKEYFIDLFCNQETKILARTQYHVQVEQ
jgi:hypothetical protein